MTDGYIKPQHKSHPALRFVKQYQTEIMIGAVIILTVKNRSLSKDIQRLSQASVIHSNVMGDMIKTTEQIIDRMKPMDVEVGWLREDIADVSRTFDDVFIRLDVIGRWMDTAQEKVEALELVRK